MESGKSRFTVVSPYALLCSKDLVSGREGVREIGKVFANLRDSGTTGVIWHAAVCGKALYHTRAGTRLSRDTRKKGRRLEAVLADVDLLDAAAGIAGDSGLEFIAACRPYDDYFPGLGSDFEALHQEYLWESRDGELKLRGVLSLAHRQAREYRLAIIEELASYRCTGVAIDLGSTAASMTPIRRRDFFGYNAAIAEEHRRRFGEDIRAFDDAEYRRGHDLQVVDAVYIGGEFNREGWHAVKGDFFAGFLREASRIVKSNNKRLALVRGREEGILPMARMALPAEKWLKEGVVDDVFLPYGAGEDRDLGTYFAARTGIQRVITGMPNEEADGLVDFSSDASPPARIPDDPTP